MSEKIALAAKALEESQVRRKFLIGAMNKQANAVAALVRRQLGYDGKNSAATNEAIKARAASIVGRAFSGKPQSNEDLDAVRSVIADLNVVVIASEPLKTRRLEVEKDMVRVAKDLPVYSWMQSVKGFGPLALAIVIGETGDLSNYPHWRMVWKRLGLMPFDGKALSSWRRQGGLSAKDWETAGYNPRRRAEIYACVGDPMSKHQLVSALKSGSEFGAPAGPYGAVYVARREKTLVDHPDWTKAHARADALRIMTKALVSDLWSEWRRGEEHEMTMVSTDAGAHPAPPHIDSAELADSDPQHISGLSAIQFVAEDHF